MNAPPIILFPAGVEYSSIYETYWEELNEGSGGAHELIEVSASVFCQWVLAAKSIREQINTTYLREVTDEPTVSYSVSRTRNNASSAWTHPGTPPINGFIDPLYLLFVNFPDRVEHIRAFVRRGKFYFLAHHVLYTGEDADDLYGSSINAVDNPASISITGTTMEFTASVTVSYEGFHQVETSTAVYTITDVYQAPPPP